MTLRSIRRTPHLAGLTAVVLVATACGGGSDPLAADPPATDAAAATSVTVGSADFTESQLLALIYTEALQAKGVQVAQPRLGIGAREAYMRGMSDGSINVIPEYTGALATYLDPEFSETEAQATYDTLAGLLPDDLRLLQRSLAENKDSVTVTRATATERSLRTISDLAPVANQMSIGAPPEFKARQQGLLGLQSVYRLEFRTVRELTGQALIQALASGQVDAANVFTTNPAIVANDFVVLEDDQSLFGAQNVVPLVTAQVAQDQNAVDALDGVSQALTTEGLQQMLQEVEVDQQDPAAVAAAFVEQHDLG